jgi:hypothetical protein
VHSMMSFLPLYVGIGNCLCSCVNLLDSYRQGRIDALHVNSQGCGSHTNNCPVIDQSKLTLSLFTRCHLRLCRYTKNGGSPHCPVHTHRCHCNIAASLLHPPSLVLLASFPSIQGGMEYTRSCQFCLIKHLVSG